MHKPLVFFVDLDHTLLDTDRVKTEIRHSLIKVLGHSEAKNFWKHHDEFVSKFTFADFPNIIRQYCVEKHTSSCDVILRNIFFIIDFKMALYPSAISLIKHLKSLGKLAIFTEGDKAYQKRKIEQLGLKKIVDKIYFFEKKAMHIDEIKMKWSEYTKIFIDDRPTSESIEDLLKLNQNDFSENI